MTKTMTVPIRLDSATRLRWDWLKLLAKRLGSPEPTMTELCRTAISSYCRNIDTAMVEAPENISYLLSEMKLKKKPEEASITIQQVQTKLAHGLKPLQQIQAELVRERMDKLLAGYLDAEVDEYRIP